MTIPEIAEKWVICVTLNGKKLRVDSDVQNHPEDLAFLQEHKQEIISYLVEKKEREYQESRVRLYAIEGLKELEDAYCAWQEYYSLFSYYINELGAEGKAPEKPDVSIDDLIKKYPRARAYMIADSYAQSENDIKVTAGEKAKQRIINGDDYKQAVSEMEKEWSDYCNESIFDN